MKRGFLRSARSTCRTNFTRHPGAIRRDGRFIGVWLLVLMSKLREAQS